MPSFTSAARALFANRRRFAPAVIAIGVLIVGGQLMGSAPREVHLRYDLGEAHAEVEETELDYFLAGERIQSVRFAYPEGAPARLDHRVSVAPGRYDVVVTLRTPTGARSLERSFDAPAEGLVRVQLAK